MGPRSKIDDAFAGHQNMWATSGLERQMSWSGWARIVALAGTPDRTAGVSLAFMSQDDGPRPMEIWRAASMSWIHD
jgi:hypothetical protein